MDSNKITKLPALNPNKPPASYPQDDPSQAVGKAGETMARNGYEVLDRANARSRYNPDRPGLSQPVYEPMRSIVSDD